MQVYEILYESRKGLGLARTFEHIPLDDDRPNLALRALHPDYRLVSVRPFGQPIRDSGQYTYWWISFRYDKGPFINIPTDSDADLEATKNLSSAERCVDYALTKLGIQHKHSYSWPDGSLCYTIRILDRDASGWVDLINSEIAKLVAQPITVRRSHTYQKRRTYDRCRFGAFPVTVEHYSKIESPWETDPMKGGCLNYVEYFEQPPLWRRWNKELQSAEDMKNPLHKAFSAGFEEAFGHQRLFHYTVKPSEYAVQHAQAKPGTEEECATYAGAYILGKVLLTLALPDGATQKPWRFLLDEPESETASSSF